MLGAATLAAVGTQVAAQDAQETEARPVEEAAIVPEAQPSDTSCPLIEPETVTLAKMTPVYLRIDADLGSKVSISGQTFGITVVEPVMLDDREIIPVGTKGQGEVIHAKKAGGSGTAGELILTANYIELGDQQIPLRSMKLGLSGQDQTDLAIATGAVAGPIGFLIRGKNIDVAEGSLAGAKLARETEIVLAGSDDDPAQNCEVEDFEGREEP